MEYPWYEILRNSPELQQGDFIPQCPIVLPPKNLPEGENVDIEFDKIDSVILSQSCDLVNNKLDIVLVCPYNSLQTFLNNLPASERSTKKAREKAGNNLRKGLLPGYHLLQKNENSPFEDYQVVDFRNVYGVHIESLTQVVSELEQRIRLLPPYREHLSQSFARYFMRVGLPQDIAFSDYKFTFEE
jgi:hypothetical protein